MVLRSGFSTGSCASAAAKAAAQMLFSQEAVSLVRVETPKGVVFDAEILDAAFDEREARCAVRKDGGDDPDITTGAYVYASVQFAESEAVVISGGKGVGVVTKPGLDQPVGNAAINSGPRKQIEAAVREVMDSYGYVGGLAIEISVPDGEKLAAKTFNPKLGIVGGISILGTSGVVEPFSSDALRETIRLSLSQQFALYPDVALLVPGNYGLQSLESLYGIAESRCVLCSNFIGFAIDEALKAGFSRILLAGHVGKLVKLGQGIMNTHSREGDGRLETLAVAAVEVLEGEDFSSLPLAILRANTTEEALEILDEAEMLAPVMARVMERIHYYLKKRIGEGAQIECLVFSNRFGLVGMTEKAEELICTMKKMGNQR